MKVLLISLVGWIIFIGALYITFVYGVDNFEAKLCDYGKTKSCHNAGYWSHVGSEEPKIHINLDRAFRYYTKACDKKIPQSCHNLGILYSDKNDFENSMKYFEKGCELKFIPSCYQAMNKILEAQPKNPLQIKQGLKFGAKICDLNKDFCDKSKQDKIMKNMNLKIQGSLK